MKKNCYRFCFFILNAVRGADCVKGDFRVAQDNVGVVAHSSPILFYESPECKGKLIENMTSTQVTQCHLTVTSQTYITVPHLLDWAQVNAQIEVWSIRVTIFSGQVNRHAVREGVA